MERRLGVIWVADMVGFSRLMEADEVSTLLRRKLHLETLIEPLVEKFQGRVLKTTGDGVLAEFTSIITAVKCAQNIQRSVFKMEADVQNDRRILYRIGINLGDVVFDQNDVFGDGVNIAARLEGLAEPGGVCVSDAVKQLLDEENSRGFWDLGRQQVKNIKRPIRVWHWTTGSQKDKSDAVIPTDQRVRFCRSKDGTTLSWAGIGKGTPVLRAPHWLNHIEYEWTNPIYAPFLSRFAEISHFVRFDQRGNGLSDLDFEDLSMDAMIDDMEAVVAAAELNKFSLFGSSQGAMFAVEYARRHPEQVKCIVLLGGYLRGRLSRKNADDERLYHASYRMISEGWGASNPLFRDVFVSTFLPDASPKEREKFDEFQRHTTVTDNALKIFEFTAKLDVSASAALVETPCLIAHVEGDRVASHEETLHLARTLQNSRIVELPGNNHLITSGTPAFEAFFEAAGDFFSKHG